MNKQLQEFARTTLKAMLAKCPESQQLIFKRMYSHEDLTLPIGQIVDRMPEHKLDWAMQQVANTPAHQDKEKPA